MRKEDFEKLGIPEEDFQTWALTHLKNLFETRLGDKIIKSRFEGKFLHIDLKYDVGLRIEVKGETTQMAIIFPKIVPNEMELRKVTRMLDSAGAILSSESGEMISAFHGNMDKKTGELSNMESVYTNTKYN